MPLPVAKNTRSKPIKVLHRTWLSMKQEAPKHEASLMTLIGVAWDQFMLLPESKRERLVREFDSAAAA